MELLAAVDLRNLLNIVAVAFGLGLVIFIHELGHFAVAKWCGVKVERFSIGFGPVLLRYTKGETEYALSAIPLGGYVKMLGQDDADPSQMTDDRVAKDPRSYTSKSVPQRMAIISAGVINNIITAALFFIIAFLMGVTYEPAIIGDVAPGFPAWKGGLRMGDQITRIGSRQDNQMRFLDFRQTVALSHGSLIIEGLRDGKPFTTEVEPERRDQIFPTMGVDSTRSLRLMSNLPEKILSPTREGMAAARAQPPLAPGDEIVAIDQEPLSSYTDMVQQFARKRDKDVTLTVKRTKGSTSENVDIRVGTNNFHTLGISMEIGKISAIQKGSPAEKNGLQEGDKITYVLADGKELAIGVDLDPLRLPDFLDRYVGQEVLLKVKREVQGSEPKMVDVRLIPDDRPSWIEKPRFESESALSIPSIGIAYHVLHHVVAVQPGGPADGILKPDDNILSLRFIDSKASQEAQAKPIEFEKKQNWCSAFWEMQSFPGMPVELVVRSQGAETKTVTLTPKPDPSWFLPVRGLMPEILTRTRKAGSISEAAVLGLQHTRDSVVEMYLTLRSLITGRVSMRALGGPISIWDTASYFAKKGMADLILFLGMLSVSLAVVNFLPIPVLDGGHFVFLAWEGIRGKPAHERVILTAQYIGLGLILSLMIWVMYLDISRKIFGP